ncbi:NAD(P)H-dependent glycerol-3-phosphate dehydrogenase [Phragmitibacter flavus]|uniref:Glycerol-3-phosphate dehydrogenase [NAD(P)+] n=1 Tax=Phragmitibacter flavus TaxID=2576071 RepID=A0A5R8KDN7_9BACT|nr:NAD(P)H-dependent glycerol-3-phosphate dehydrogenase [Phragmitibacter flavus]TLD70367.1 NAD(P)H-dependent glycerol-3-phosphate dehydrogenase [Phragmitibacter flavus]
MATFSHENRGSSISSERIKVAVLGAGNMGTALAHALAGNGHEVVLWDFFPEVVEDIQNRRENRRFLPDVRLHEMVRATMSAVECVMGARLVVVSVPSPFVASTLGPIMLGLENHAVLLNVAKGFAPGTRHSLLSMLERLAPTHACVQMAGPAIANEFARGTPASVVLATADELVARRVADWLSGPCFITETTTDVTGASLGGILKNVYAILLGCLDVLGKDSRNVEAAALTASVREMARIAEACGGQALTLYGLAGMGDLVATGLSQDSHNRKFGKALASGKLTSAIEAEIKLLPEGARAVAAVCALAHEADVPAPLAGWVRRTVEGTPPSWEGLLNELRAATRAASGTPPQPVGDDFR